VGSKARRPRSHYYVYVVELDPAILQRKKFRDLNPRYVAGKPCVYVGLTGLSPERRFRNHKRGYQANPFVRDYGWELRRDLFPDGNPFTYADGLRQEEYAARELRRIGYGVWQN
jgi:hypothetical protein